MRYERVLAEIYRKPWAILPEKFAQISEIVDLRAAGSKLSKKEIQDRLAPHLAARAARDIAMEARSAAVDGGFGVAALIPIYGVISQRMNLMSEISGGCSVQKLTSQFRAALADPSIKVIVFDVDSPGGSVEGIPELAEEIYKSRGKKKTVAVVNALCASAAYWLACSATEIVITQSGQVGSIGVFCAHEDRSAAMEKAGIKVSLISAGKYKVEGNPYEALSDEARSALQLRVDSFYDTFVKQVARGRGTSQAAVREGFGQGRLVVAGDAVKQKMVDGVATLDETLARVSPGAAPKKMTAQGSTEIEADVLEETDDLPDDDEESCQCKCSACVEGNCESCSLAECTDEECEGCPMQKESAKASARADLVDRRRKLDLCSRT